MITNEPTETNFIGITGIEAKMEQIDEWDCENKKDIFLEICM